VTTFLPPLVSVLAGLAAGLSLIVVIGAQNAYVLRQGILGLHVPLVVGFCALSDALLIVLGTLGVGVLTEQRPMVLDLVRWVGVAFLVAYAVLAARRAMLPETLEAQQARGQAGRSAVVVLAAVAAFTWLNPHVYLDTVVLLGSLANAQGADRWWFALGAVMGSIMWFCGLGFGARLLAPVFARPTAWRVLDLAIAAMMAALAVGLVVGT
jgi:L-lysine exporter family protein LysE/ArgO